MQQWLCHERNQYKNGLSLGAHQRALDSLAIIILRHQPKDNKHHRARKAEHSRIADAEAERRRRKRCGSASPCATASRRRASSRRGLQRTSLHLLPRVASRNSCKIGSAHFAINIKRTDEPKPFVEGYRVALERRRHHGRGRRAVSEAWAIENDEHGRGRGRTHQHRWGGMGSRRKQGQHGYC